MEELHRQYTFGFTKPMSRERVAVEHDVLPLIRAIMESGCNQITMSDLRLLLDVQGRLGRDLTPKLIRELINDP
ncbi:MAG: hypothetical protein AAB925_01635 [Patescibacteria group bacterium]